MLTLVGAAFAIAIGVGMRIHNAITYTPLWGFDAHFNWRYIEFLTGTWLLPAPHAFWSSAHPPLYYYVSAAIVRLLDHPDLGFNVVALRLAASVAGLVPVGLAYAVVRRLDPEHHGRALLAGGLLLFLPVNIYMSAMVNEETFAAAFVSIVLAGWVWEHTRPNGSYAPAGFAIALGAIAGLAMLTKLTGVLVVIAVAGAYLVDGWRRNALAPALLRATIFSLAAALTGGWYYARNLILYGFIYPHGLETHKLMLKMPPGERQLWDYLNLPAATWLDPQVRNPDLLHSVWGSTYVTMWFDGHRAFLPRNDASVDAAGTLILTLALLPMSAFALGLVRGTRRACASPRTADSLFLAILGLTLAGYVFFTWRNPWFVTLKANFLLSLSLPFAFYASEPLARWLRKRGPAAIFTSVTLVGLVLSIVIALSQPH